MRLVGAALLGAALAAGVHRPPAGVNEQQPLEVHPPERPSLGAVRAHRRGLLRRLGRRAAFPGIASVASKLEQRRLRRRRIHAEVLAELGAAIVEMRAHPGLGPVLDNVCSTLQGIPVEIFHGRLNGAFARSAVPRSCTDARFLRVNADNLDQATYSMLLTSHAFWDRVARPRVLVFQTDSGICATHTLAPLLEAARFDYCGAPWSADEVGNGGFSVRSRVAMLSMLSTMKQENTTAEDLAFNRACSRSTTCKICPIQVATRFSYESHYPGLGKAWAFHQAVYGTAESCDFHGTVRRLHESAPKGGEVPDPATWAPVVHAEAQ